MLNMFAHTGHDHTVITIAQSSEVGQQIFISLAAVLPIVLCWLLFTYVWRVALATRLLITLGVLLVGGIGLYELAPIFSTVAIATGLALTLGLTLLQLSKKH